MKHGALVLSAGGTLAALVQAFDHARIAGAIMLCANLIVIGAALLERWQLLKPARAALAIMATRVLSAGGVLAACVQALLARWRS